MTSFDTWKVRLVGYGYFVYATLKWPVKKELFRHQNYITGHSLYDNDGWLLFGA